MRGSNHRAIAIVAVALALLAGCSSKPPEQPTQEIAAPVSMQLLAVLPVEPATAPGDDATVPPPPEAGLAVTAQIYRVLADQTEFRFVADLSVSDVLTTPALRRADGVAARAVALGKEVGADGVIFGRVFRFDKRVGTGSGAKRPASVWFELGLVRVSDGDVTWQGSFEQTQAPPSSSLFNWWMFWRPSPRWFSASELAGQGVDRLFADMTETVNAEE